MSDSQLHFQTSITCSKSENVELGLQLQVRFEIHILLQVFYIFKSLKNHLLCSFVAKSIVLCLMPINYLYYIAFVLNEYRMINTPMNYMISHRRRNVSFLMMHSNIFFLFLLKTYVMGIL